MNTRRYADRIQDVPLELSPRTSKETAPSKSGKAHRLEPRRVGEHVSSERLSLRSVRSIDEARVTNSLGIRLHGLHDPLRFSWMTMGAGADAAEMLSRFDRALCHR